MVRAACELTFIWNGEKGLKNVCCPRGAYHVFGPTPGGGRLTFVLTLPSPPKEGLKGEDPICLLVYQSICLSYLLTSLMQVSLVLRLPRKMYLRRASSNAPRMPSVLRQPHFPHFWQGAGSRQLFSILIWK